MRQGINLADYGCSPFNAGQLTREDIQVIVDHARTTDA